MIARLLLLLCFVNVNFCVAQNCLDEILHNKLYSGSNDIINGKKWIYEKKYSGSPLLTGDYWPEATISYNGVDYKEVLVNYDVNKNEIIIYYPEKGKEKYVVINTDHLSGFSFSDSLLKRDRFFEYVELQGIKGKTLYENASAGIISCYIKPVKDLVIGSSGKGGGIYDSYFEYFLNTGTGFSGFHSKKQFISYLGTYSTEANRFIKKNRLKINNQNPENIITVLNYLNGLK